MKPYRLAFEDLVNGEHIDTVLPPIITAEHTPYLSKLLLCAVEDDDFGIMNKILKKVTDPAQKQEIISYYYYRAFARAVQNRNFKIVNEFLAIVSEDNLPRMIEGLGFAAVSQVMKCGDHEMYARLLEAARGDLMLMKRMVSAFGYVAISDAATFGRSKVVEVFFANAGPRLKKEVLDANSCFILRTSHLGDCAKIVEMVFEATKDDPEFRKKMLSSKKFQLLSQALTKNDLAMAIIFFAEARNDTEFREKMIKAIRGFGPSVIAKFKKEALNMLFSELDRVQIETIISDYSHDLVYQVITNNNSGAMEVIFAATEDNQEFRSSMIKSIMFRAPGIFNRFVGESEGVAEAMEVVFSKLDSLQIKQMLSSQNCLSVRDILLSGYVSIMDRVFLEAKDDPDFRKKVTDAIMKDGCLFFSSIKNPAMLEKIFAEFPNIKKEIIAANSFALFHAAAARGDAAMLDILFATAADDPEFKKQMLASRNFSILKSAMPRFYGRTLPCNVEVVDRIFAESDEEQIQAMIKANRFAAFHDAFKAGSSAIVSKIFSKLSKEQIKEMVAANEFEVFCNVMDFAMLDLVLTAVEDDTHFAGKKAADHNVFQRDMIESGNFGVMLRAIYRHDIAMVNRILAIAKDDPKFLEAMLLAGDCEAFRASLTEKMVPILDRILAAAKDDPALRKQMIASRNFEAVPAFCITAARLQRIFAASDIEQIKKIIASNNHQIVINFIDTKDLEAIDLILEVLHNDLVAKRDLVASLLPGVFANLGVREGAQVVNRFLFSDIDPDQRVAIATSFVDNPFLAAHFLSYNSNFLKIVHLHSLPDADLRNLDSLDFFAIEAMKDVQMLVKKEMLERHPESNGELCAQQIEVVNEITRRVGHYIFKNKSGAIQEAAKHCKTIAESQSIDEESSGIKKMNTDLVEVIFQHKIPHRFQQIDPDNYPGNEGDARMANDIALKMLGCRRLTIDGIRKFCFDRERPQALCVAGAAAESVVAAGRGMRAASQ